MSYLDIIFRIITRVMRDPSVSAVARYAARQATAAIVRHIRQKTAHRKGQEVVG